MIPFLSLTGMEVFFIITTILSLGFNILQWRESKASKEPLANTLVGTFNDIKLKTNAVFFAYNALFNSNNPHKEVNTLRWEYGLFIQYVLNFLQSLQEQVVSVLVSLRPDDKEGKLAFRASDYGLTEQDKELRRESFEQFKARMAPKPPDQELKEKSEVPVASDGD